ncbi:hypothetical protein MNEG_10168, partial [Monoraphidium neglectum]
GALHFALSVPGGESSQVEAVKFAAAAAVVAVGVPIAAVAGAAALFSVLAQIQEGQVQIQEKLREEFRGSQRELTAVILGQQEVQKQTARVDAQASRIDTLAGPGSQSGRDGKPC